MLIATSFCYCYRAARTEGTIDCLSSVENAPQKFSRASRAPLPVVDASIIHVEPTPSSPKSCIRPCNDIRNSDRKAACVFVCVCVGEGGGGGGGGGGSLCICPPSDRQATSPLGGRGGGGGICPRAPVEGGRLRM